MRASHRSWLSLVTVVGFALAIAPEARAQRAPKPVPATKADIERLEKRIEEQQRVVDKLIKLQQQYFQSLMSMFDGPAQAAMPEPKVDDLKVDVPKPEPKQPEPKAFVDKPKQPVKAAEPKPKPKKPDGTGTGTVVGKIAGAADAVVYIEDIVVSTRGSASMKQEGKQFVPQVLVVQKGTTVQFPNMDAVFHNVFSVSPDNSFDLGSYRQGETKGMPMTRPGVVSVYCNMHPQMVGHILVVPNGNFVYAGKDGFFRLTNVPNGRHRVVAWAPNAKPSVVDAEVKDGEVVTVELSLKKGRGGPHLKKDGLPYGSYEK